MSSKIPSQPMIGENTIQEQPGLVTTRNLYMFGISIGVLTAGYFLINYMMQGDNNPVAQGLEKVEDEQEKKEPHRYK
jgi:hypothetical protein